MEVGANVIVVLVFVLKICHPWNSSSNMEVLVPLFSPTGILMSLDYREFTCWITLIAYLVFFFVLAFTTDASVDGRRKDATGMFVVRTLDPPFWSATGRRKLMRPQEQS